MSGIICHIARDLKKKQQQQQNKTGIYTWFACLRNIPEYIQFNDK